MTIPEQTDSKAEQSAAGAGAASPSAARVTRPTLEREAPIRNWTTLFGPAWGATAAPGAAPSAAGAVAANPVLPGMAGVFGAASQTLSDAVGQGYRVINDYLAQGQRQAEALRFPDWSSFLPNGAGLGAGFVPGVAGFGASATPNAGGAQGAQDAQQQLFRRFMQYGMDFAALWFEMGSRMGWPMPPGGAAGVSGAGVGGATGVGGGVPAAWTEAFSRAAAPFGAAAPFAAAPFAAAPGTPPAWPFAMPFPWGAPPAAAPPSASEAAAPSQSAPSQNAPSSSAPSQSAGTAPEGPERVFVSVSSECRVESVLELRRGSWSTLVVHALRPEGHDGPAIVGVSIDARPEESTLRVSVQVPADQAPGVYNGMLVDTASNLPRGTLTVRVLATGAE